tara:strand:- start:681 stop:1163 length:483 start_codon:yes stop_codon:yes gene_type:complete
MELKSNYTQSEIEQVEHYVVRLHEFICSHRFQNIIWTGGLKDSFYQELLYAKHFAQITRKIFLDPSKQTYVALQMNKERIVRDGCIKAYKIPSKQLLFHIFNIKNEIQWRKALIYEGRSFDTIDGYGFMTLEDYLNKESNPLITDTRSIIDFIALKYEEK